MGSVSFITQLRRDSTVSTASWTEKDWAQELVWRWYVVLPDPSCVPVRCLVQIQSLQSSSSEGQGSCCKVPCSWLRPDPRQQPLGHGLEGYRCAILCACSECSQRWSGLRTFSAHPSQFAFREGCLKVGQGKARQGKKCPKHLSQLSL